MPIQMRMERTTAVRMIGKSRCQITGYCSNHASDDDEDETAELQRELEKIKRERAIKREQEVRISLPLPTCLA